MEIVCVGRSFTFAAAHRIPSHEGNCRNLHGHNWKLEVKLCGYMRENGMVVDFRDIDKLVNELIISKLDHQYLNDLGPHLANPTAEIIVSWIGDNLKDSISINIKTMILRLWESEKNYAEIELEL